MTYSNLSQLHSERKTMSFIFLSPGEIFWGRGSPWKYGGPKGSYYHKSVYQNTKQFPKTQINFPKHKSVYQNTKQCPKTQIGLPKRKTISQKHKLIFQNTNQLSKTQINFSKHKPISWKHKSKDWALALLLSESLERTHSQDFPCPTWRLLICCRCSKMFCHNSRSEVLQEYSYCSQCGTKLDIVVQSLR